MSRHRLLAIAAVVVVFVVVGAVLVFNGVNGTGRAVTIRLSVSGATMTPDNPTATQNDSVTMTITADKKEEVHLHGYDIQFAIPGPGQSVTRTFKADKSGGFDLEIEDTSTPLGKFTVNPK